MRLSDKKIKAAWNKNTEISVGEEQVAATVKRAKEAYCKAEEGLFLSRTDFLFQQSRYIRKSWWLLQGLLLFGVWLLMEEMESSDSIQRSIGVAAPVFALLIMPEVWKNKSANAMEIEGTTYFSLRQIYSARLVLFGFADLVMISVFFAGASVTGRIPAGELIIQFLIPFNVTCGICFHTFYSKRGTPEALALLLGMLWTIVWVEIVLKEEIYRMISVPAWMAMLGLSGLYLALVIRRGQRQCMELWEGKTLWN